MSRISTTPATKQANYARIIFLCKFVACVSMSRDDIDAQATNFTNKNYASIVEKYVKRCYIETKKMNRKRYENINKIFTK